MLNNKADTIEEYILKLLSEQQEGWLELKRTELADKISCAPSQISYVLNTRFTQARGFAVESRRGMGGYIRITIVTEAALDKQLLYSELIGQIDEETPFENIKSMLKYLLKNRLITPREAELAAQMSVNLYRSENDNKLEAAERARLIRSIFATFANMT